MARRKRFQQFRVGQENLIDEIHIFDALGEQSVELGEDDRQGSPAIAVTEILFSTERAVIGAAPRGLDFRAGTPRGSVEAVVVMIVPQDHVAWPLQRRKSCHVGGVGPTLYARLA